MYRLEVPLPGQVAQGFQELQFLRSAQQLRVTMLVPTSRKPAGEDGSPGFTHQEPRTHAGEGTKRILSRLPRNGTCSRNKMLA
jgi:hypothetical protein